MWRESLCVKWLTHMCERCVCESWDSLLYMLPDPIRHVCSLTGKYISRKHYTYRSVHIFKIMFRRFLFSRIWSSAQDHALLVLLLNLVVVFISSRPRWTGGNYLYHSSTRFEGASRGGQPFNIFTWFIGAGGEATHSYMWRDPLICVTWPTHTCDMTTGDWRYE